MNEELNKKLAEWAGFEHKLNTESSNLFHIIGQEDIEVMRWFTPDGTCLYSNHIPDFTQSLDACFKWFVPRLWICNITLEEAIFWNVVVSIPDYHGRNKHGNGQALDENPALALCLAIEKLIDGGKQ